MTHYTYHPPLHERRHPTARRIALDVPEALLRLSTGLLVGDIMGRHGCGLCTARIAVVMARQRSIRDTTASRPWR